MKKLARKVKRSQLIRSWQSVVEAYLAVSGKKQEEAADWLLALEEQGKLIISFDCVDELLEARIERLA